MHVNTVNNGHSVQCSSRCHDSARQDPDTTAAHAGDRQEPNVDTSFSQHTATSDLAQISASYPNYLRSMPTPTLQGLETVFNADIAVRADMGRFNKRAYRQGHQTREFFEYQPTADQQSSDRISKSGMTAAGGSQHRAVVKGTVQNCPGAENCADCKAGRSAPVRGDGSEPLPGESTARSSELPCICDSICLLFAD